MSMLQLSSLNKFALLGMSPATIEQLKGFAAPMGIGAGVGALGMGAADMLGNHDDEQEGERTPNLLKSMALGGVLGGGAGGAYHAGQQLLSPAKGITNIQKNPPMFSSWKGLTNPGPAAIAGGAVGGTVLKRDYDRYVKGVGKDGPKSFEGASFNVFPDTDSSPEMRDAFNTAHAIESDRVNKEVAKNPGLTNDAIAKEVQKRMGEWTELHGPSAALKLQNQISGQSNEEMRRITARKIKNIPGSDLSDYVPNRQSPPNEGTPEWAAWIHAKQVAGSLPKPVVNQLQPSQSLRAIAQNNTYGPIRTAIDVARGKNPYTKNVPAVTDVNFDTMSKLQRGIFGGKGGVKAPEGFTSAKNSKGVTTPVYSEGLSQHYYTPENALLRNLREHGGKAKLPLTYQRQWPIRGVGAGFGTTLGLNLLNRGFTTWDNLSRLTSDPDYKKLIEAETNSPAPAVDTSSLPYVNRSMISTPGM